MFLLQKEGQFLTGHDLFLKRIGAAYHAFLEESEVPLTPAPARQLVQCKGACLFEGLRGRCAGAVPGQVPGGPAVHHALRHLEPAHQVALLTQAYALQGASGRQSPVLSRIAASAPIIPKCLQGPRSSSNFGGCLREWPFSRLALHSTLPLLSGHFSCSIIDAGVGNAL